MHKYHDTVFFFTKSRKSEEIFLFLFLTGWLVLPGPFREMGTWCTYTMELQQCAGDPGKDSGHFHTTQRVGTPSPHKRPPLVGFPSVASYYSLGRRLHYFVPVKLVCRIGTPSMRKPLDCNLGHPTKTH